MFIHTTYLLEHMFVRCLSIKRFDNYLMNTDKLKFAYRSISDINLILTCGTEDSLAHLLRDPTI